MALHNRGRRRGTKQRRPLAHDPDDELIGELTALTTNHPIREQFRGQLMLALVRSGRQAEALKSYGEIHDLLIDELGVDPGPELRALHERILRGDPALAAPPVTRHRGRNDLPGDLADFTGRDQEMARLLAALPGERDISPTAVVIEAIDGMAGVGKTALAVHAAHHLADRYPDAQMFIDLHGHTPGHVPTDPAAALDVLLRAVGVPGDQIPHDPQARAALWRAELADRKALVVLDNAASAAQVRPLLPGTAGCLTLITSRRRLADLEAARILSVNVLPRADAIAMFIRIVADEGVIQLNPRTPAVQCHPLHDDPAALAWFDIEHPNLLAAQHTAITHGWYETGWELAWALITFHSRRGHVHENLTVWQAALTAATWLANPAIQSHTHRRLGDSYADLNRHDDAIRHLHHALSLAEDLHDPTQQALTHHDLAYAWARHGNDQCALEHVTQALRLYRTLDQPVWEAAALNGVGWFSARLGDYGTARAHCQAALALYRQHPACPDEADVLDSLGYIDHHSGQHHNSVQHYQQALVLYRNLGNDWQTASTLDRLGHPYAVLGHHAQARAAWREALKLLRQQARHQDAERVRRQLDTLDQS